MVNIFKYTDYREYLKDWCEEEQGNSDAFSFRNFARRAGLASPSFLKMVINGKRNLASERIPKFADALKLSGDERKFFADLVLFDQAKTNAEKNHHYQRLTRCKQFLNEHQLELERFEYFSKWYIAAIREMVELDDFDVDPAWIAARLRPRITEAEAAHAIETLERLGFVKRTKGGKLVLDQRNVTTADRVRSMHLANFHKSMIRRAEESLSNSTAEDRSVSSITVAMSKGKFERIRKRIDDFRKELRALLEGDEETREDVYQINFQLFSLTGEAGDA